jgi:hypothetical protein
MELSGHRTASVYRRYAIKDEAVLNDAGAKLSAWLAGQTLARSVTPEAPFRLQPLRGVSEVLGKMVGRDGIEPPTPGFSVLCSTN